MRSAFSPVVAYDLMPIDCSFKDSLIYLTLRFLDLQALSIAEIAISNS